MSEYSRAHFFSRKVGKWQDAPISRMTCDDLRDALRLYVSEADEKADISKAMIEERDRMRAEIESLKVEKYRLETRLDAALYAMVLMQSVLRAREDQLRAKDKATSDDLRLAV